jgi:hypothetical protein
MKGQPIRQQVLRQFPIRGHAQAPDADLAAALYALLRFADGSDLIVDGWALFRVVRESDESLDALGLMTLLPTGSVPIAINVSGDEQGFAWSAHIGRQDPHWLALSDSKRWNSVYLHATDGRDEPQWTWERQSRGHVRFAADWDQPAG